MKQGLWGELDARRRVAAGQRRANDFDCRQQVRRGTVADWFQSSTECRTPTPNARAVPERVDSLAVSRLGSPLAEVTLSVRRVAEGALAAVLAPRTRCKPSDPTRPSDPIETDQGSDSIHTRAQEPEILNMLNWPEVMLPGTGAGMEVI